MKALYGKIQDTLLSPSLEKQENLGCVIPEQTQDWKPLQEPAQEENRNCNWHIAGYSVRTTIESKKLQGDSVLRRFPQYCQIYLQELDQISE